MRVAIKQEKPAITIVTYYNSERSGDDYSSGATKIVIDTILSHRNLKRGPLFQVSLGDEDFLTDTQVALAASTLRELRVEPMKQILAPADSRVFSDGGWCSAVGHSGIGADG